MSGMCDKCGEHALDCMCKSLWKKTAERPMDDKNYLVCWKQADGSFSSPHRAYFLEDEGHFFSLENNNSHPIVADIYYEYPNPNNAT